MLGQRMLKTKFVGRSFWSLRQLNISHICLDDELLKFVSKMLCKGHINVLSTLFAFYYVKFVLYLAMTSILIVNVDVWVSYPSFRSDHVCS